MDYNLDDHAKLARYNLKQKQSKNWMNIINQSKQSRQSDLYQEEKTLMFTFINNFMTKLMIDRDRLIESRLYKSISEENMILDEFKDRMKSAHSIIIQLIGLIKVEKSVWLTSTDNTKFNVLKVKLNWMEKSIDLAIKRYNEMRIFLSLPIDNLHSEIKHHTETFKIDYISKKKRQEIERQFKFRETQLIFSDLRSPIELLQNRIVDHGITPTYRFLRRHTSGQQFVYNYSCSLFGMYVEGNGTTRYEAKVNTAAEMLRSIIRKQKSRTLSSHIRVFNEKELKSISPLIKFKSNYVEALNNECVKYFYQAPIYTLLSQPKDNSKLANHYSIQCNAMDLVAIGHSNKKSTAKQVAAQNIINLWEKLTSKSILTSAKHK